jgi:hypothetical protein
MVCGVSLPTSALPAITRASGSSGCSFADCTQRSRMLAYSSGAYSLIKFE